MRRLFWIVLVLGMLLAPAAAGPTESSGIFLDAQGGKHRWKIGADHLLTWEEQPFVPVGGLFQVRSWAPGATEADFESDVAALQKLRAAGLTDLYVQPAQGGLSLVKPAAIQRMIDALEQAGFTYGLSLNDAPRMPLIGYQILPSRYRQSAPVEGALLRFPVQDLSGALYCIALASNGEVIDTGNASVVEEGARVRVDPAPAPVTVLVYPERIFFPRRGSGLPNLWEGFESYRDSLLTLFAQVRLGKGFRFFIDPLPASLDLTGEAQTIVPSGPAFQAEWTHWLKRKYQTIATLEQAWALSERGTLKEIVDAADLVPLWFGDKGLPLLYHRTSGRRLRVDFARTASGGFWKDLDAFKIETIRTYMNDLAIALKRGAADVPVVYRSRGYSPLFARLPSARGFDGIGIDAYGTGADAVRYAGADIYAQAADAPRTMWLPVVATQESRQPASELPGFASQPALFSLLDSFREIGARGFYVDSLRLVDPARKPYDLSALPTQLTWLAEYGKLLSAAGIATAATPSARAVFYPRALASLVALAPTVLASGGWWLPTDRPDDAQYRLYDFGPAGRAYAMNDTEGVVFYLWNPAGARQIRLRLPKFARKPDTPAPYWLPAESGSRTRDVVTLAIGPEPVRLFNFPGLPIPLEAYTELYVEGASLIAAARRRKMTDVTREELTLVRLRTQFNPENPDLAKETIDELRTLVEGLRERVRPYAWIEAENAAPSAHSFDQDEMRPGASGGKVLVVRSRPDGAPTPTAAYEVRIGTDSVYRLWIAADSRASFTLRLNGLPWGGDEAPAPKPTGKPFGSPPLVWFDCGSATLTRGTHKIEVRAAGALALDVLLVTSSPFTPNGALRPPVLP